MQALASQIAAQTFVIRSMSTTNYQMAYRSGGMVIPEQKPQPYHVFLMRPEDRRRAYWNRCCDQAMPFRSKEDAEAEALKEGLTSFDIVPANFADIGIPAYWESH